MILGLLVNWVVVVVGEAMLDKIVTGLLSWDRERGLVIIVMGLPDRDVSVFRFI